MKHIFQIEMKRAFCNRLFFISLFIGCFLTIADAIMNCVPTMLNLNCYGLPEGAYCFSVFQSFGYFVTSHSIWFSIFFMIFPILSSAAFADSYYVDRKSGYIKNLYTRSNKRNYLISKYIAVFLSGGSVVTLPLLLNLYVSVICLPAVIPTPGAGTFPLFSNSTGGELFYSHPFWFSLLFYILIFVTAGALSIMALAFSYLFSYRYIITLTPFFVVLFISFISGIISFPEIDINTWVNVTMYNHFNPLVTIIELLAFLLVTGVLYFYKGMNDDVY